MGVRAHSGAKNGAVWRDLTKVNRQLNGVSQGQGCYGLRNDESVDGSESRGFNGATTAGTQRISQTGFWARLEIPRLCTKRTDRSLVGGERHANADDISMVSDFAQTPWIYPVPGIARGTLAGALTTRYPRGNRPFSGLQVFCS